MRARSFIFEAPAGCARRRLAIFSLTDMKKFALLAAGAAVLTLGACNKERCPAYSATKAANRVSSPVTASTAAPVARQ